MYELCCHTGIVMDTFLFVHEIDCVATYLDGSRGVPLMLLLLLNNDVSVPWPL